MTNESTFRRHELRVCYELVQFGIELVEGVRELGWQSHSRRDGRAGHRKHALLELGPLREALSSTPKCITSWVTKRLPSGTNYAGYCRLIE